MNAEVSAIHGFIHDVAFLVVLKVGVWQITASVVREDEYVLLCRILLSCPVDEVGQRIRIGIVVVLVAVEVFVAEGIDYVRSLLHGEAVGLTLIVLKRLLSLFNMLACKIVLGKIGSVIFWRELVVYHDIGVGAILIDGLKHVVDVIGND